MTELANAKTAAEVDAIAAELNEQIRNKLSLEVDDACLYDMDRAFERVYKNTPVKEAATLGIYGMLNQTLERTDEYFKISLKHAKKSFVFSIVACALGLLLLCFAVALAAIQRDIKAAIVPAIGATVTNFIAATVFWVHNKSAKQLNRYYDSLHEIAVFYSSMNVVEMISDEEKKDAAYNKIIDELFNIQKIKAALPGKHDSKPKDKEG